MAIPANVPFLVGARSSIEGSTWPPLHLGRAATLAALSAQLAESQWYSPATLLQLQNTQLDALLAHAARHAPHFAQRLAQAGLTLAELSNEEGFQRLPVIRRRQVQDAGPDLFSRELPKSHAPVHTAKSSGSTGEPVVIHRTAVNQMDWMATTLRDHRWHQRDFSRRLCAIRPQSDQPERLSHWGGPVSLLFASAPSLILAPAMSLSRLAAEIERFNPAYLLLYPSILAGLLDHWHHHGGVPAELCEVRLIGETFSASARDAATAALGVKFTDLYSSQEVGNIALQCPDSGQYHVMAENLRVEILDDSDRPCAPGRIGRVVVTDLRNFATPLIRYDLGDYAEVVAPCSCGRGLPTLGRILGRERNLVQLPDGERHWPQVGYQEYRQIAPIRQYQLIQRSRERIEVRLCVDGELTQGQEAALSKLIRGNLGYAFQLEFVYFAGHLPASPNGKFEEFICQL